MASNLRVLLRCGSFSSSNHWLQRTLQRHKTIASAYQANSPSNRHSRPDSRQYGRAPSRGAPTKEAPQRSIHIETEPDHMGEIPKTMDRYGSVIIYAGTSHPRPQVGAVQASKLNCCNKSGKNICCCPLAHDGTFHLQQMTKSTSALKSQKACTPCPAFLILLVLMLSCRSVPDDTEGWQIAAVL